MVQIVSDITNTTFLLSVYDANPLNHGSLQPKIRRLVSIALACPLHLRKIKKYYIYFLSFMNCIFGWHTISVDCLFIGENADTSYVEEQKLTETPSGAGGRGVGGWGRGWGRGLGFSLIEQSADRISFIV